MEPSMVAMLCEFGGKGRGARTLVYLCEGLADRATRPDGMLVPRSEPGALITDPAAAAARARSLLAAGDVDTICVHGDSPGSLAIASAVRSALDDLQDPRRVRSDPV